MRRRTVLSLLGASLVAGCNSSEGEEPTPVPDCAGEVTPGPAGAASSRRLQEARKLALEDGTGPGSFGRSVSVSADGSRALVGARWDEGRYRSRPGAAFVFERVDGTWHRQATLAVSAADDDNYGAPVALSGDGTTALVAAAHAGPDTGAVYTFEERDGTWQRQATLEADDGDEDDLFGARVALARDGMTALVSALTDEDPNGTSSGSAYVFVQEDGSWRQRSKLVASDGDRGDGFGWSVALSGDGSSALVGAWQDEDPNGTAAGSAYVFERSADDWRQAAKFAAGDEEDYLGSSVALSGDGSTAIVGALGDDDFAGSAHVFERADGSWCRRSKLVAADGDREDRFGVSVALASDGRTALVGAHDDEDPNGNYAGSAYAFEQADGSWRRRSKLAASDGERGDGFGTAVALGSDGEVALIGAHRVDDSRGESAGAAYVFSA